MRNNRLTYTLDFIFNEVLGVAYSILDVLDSKVEFNGPCINYGIDKMDWSISIKVSLNYVLFL